MPRPVFIICSQFISQDKDTNLFSVFNVIEKFNFGQIEAPKEGAVLIEWQPIRITAVWMIQPGDDATKAYDYEILLLLPPDNKPLPISTGQFNFGKRPLHRFTAQILGQLPLSDEGILYAQSRIRRTGHADWLTQDYPIIVEKDKAILKPKQGGIGKVPPPSPSASRVESPSL